MEYAIGAGLALAVGIFAATVGFDRDRAFYPTVVLIVASYYELFAAMSGSSPALKLESLGVAAFLLAAVVAFRWSLWVAVAALAAHGVFDLWHGEIIANPGVPTWWPMFCSAYDVTAAGFLGVKLVLDRRTPVERRIRPWVERELSASRLRQSEGRRESAFIHLERAHVLGQNSTRLHVRVHLAMLRWAIDERDLREARGQLLRVIGAATLTVFGFNPSGNTGGVNVSAFRPMPIDHDLATILGPSNPQVLAGST